MATSEASQPSSGSVAASDASTAASNTPTGGSIALKIRTLDQKTYPIVISSDASVPQLKEIVASETGVVLARQRLIFRGKVLKNDQNIAAYALEDGHVLHLVVRAEEAEVQQTIAQAQAQREQEQSRRQVRFVGDRPQTAPSRGSGNGPLNNDEPDPTLGNGPVNRVVMGATIAVPDDMPMPFLSSVIANFVNSMGSATAEGGAGGVPGGDDPLRQQRNREIMRRLRRNRHATDGQAGPGGATGARRRGRDGGEAGGVATEGASLTNSLGGNMLRQQAEGHLRRLETTLSNTAFELPELQPREEENSATLNQDEGRVEENIAQLRGAIERFETRLGRLPSALREIGWYARHNQEAPNALVSSTVRAIDTLQNIGDSASAIARFARHVFLANSPDIPAPMVRIDSQGTMRASLLFPIVGPVGPMPGMQMPERVRPQRQQTRGSPPVQDPPAANDGNDNGSRGVLHSLYQRVTSGLLGRNNDNRGDGGAATAQSQQPPTGANNVRQDAAHDHEGDELDHITITAVSNPFHPIFPLSFSGDPMFPAVETQGRRPEWDVGALWLRLSRDLRAATAFGILGGDPVCLYELMRSLATIFVSGAYTPSLTSTPIRTWARRMLIAVRRVLGEQTIPSQLLDLTPDRDANRLIEELTRPLDPFMPELVDHIRRSSSASQGDVFGRSCTEFFRSMASQFLTRIRTYMNDDEAQAIRLLEGILLSLDVEATLAAFVVSRLVEFATPAATSTRPRAADSEAPEAKRRRVNE